MNMMEHPIACIKAEDIQKIAQTESGIKTVDGKSVILIAYEGK
jgi:hypothetical protein